MLTVIAPVLASFLSFGDVPPNSPIPQDLEICVLKAELCAAKAFQPVCSDLQESELEQCIEDYEDCSFDIPEAHEESCRMSHVWCALEAPFSIMQNVNDDFIKFCVMVDETCPSV